MVCQKAAPIWLPYQNIVSEPGTRRYRSERRLDVTYALAGLEVNLCDEKPRSAKQFAAASQRTRVVVRLGPKWRRTILGGVEIRGSFRTRRGMRGPPGGCREQREGREDSQSHACWRLEDVDERSVRRAFGEEITSWGELHDPELCG